MGGLGSGRTKTLERPAQSEAIRLNYGAERARRNFRSILKSTERQLKDNPDYVPPAQVLDVHKYVIDRVEGKAVARLEADVTTTLTLDPSLVLSAARESRLIEAEWMSHNNASATTQDEEGCRMGEPLRLVSSRAEKYELYPSEVDIMFSDGGGI